MQPRSQVPRYAEGGKSECSAMVLFPPTPDSSSTAKNTIRLRNLLRDSDARLQCGFHVPCECIAGVFTGEVDSIHEARAQQCQLW